MYQMNKRNMFEEMMQGIDEMAAQREGKITLRQVTATDRPAPQTRPSLTSRRRC